MITGKSTMVVLCIMAARRSSEVLCKQSECKRGKVHEEFLRLFVLFMSSSPSEVVDLAVIYIQWFAALSAP